MKTVIQEISDITESRELMESGPHPFVNGFIYIFIAIIVGAAIWAYFGEIDDYVKANGVIRPNEKISSIKNKVDGKVDKNFLEEGKSVKKGDILFTIEYMSLELERNTAVKELDKAREELKNTIKLKKSIVDEKNYFNPDLQEEKTYYNRYLKYITDLEVQTKQANIDSSSVKGILDQNNGLNTLRECVKQNRDLFAERDSIYYTKYKSYLLNIERLEDVIVQKRADYDNVEVLYESGASSRMEIDNALKALKSAEMDVEKYKREFLLGIDIDIDENSKLLQKLEIGIKSTEHGTGGIDLQKYRIDALVQLDSDTALLEKSIEKLEDSIESIEMRIRDCSITAPIDGVINIYDEINTGDLLQAGAEVAAIVPPADSKYKVQIYVKDSDIANIQKGQQIKYHLSALPYREYGELTGVIENIGTDAKIDQTGGVSYYIVDAAIENRPLYSYKGKMAEIRVGMTCEAQVITRTKKILYYLLEKISLRD
ncbi:HlyD family secretion protein [Anaerobacterium chartisolvens]|uniref:HlyD family secretion protein n=1 Tax=Anaerobacterium chartisolvens TaxID=1297424 RepID=A0A369AVT2_9FIRM|nr:HlyD family efflux transporter periplasmic adaptor subunit [Anaerobacterium chartisolvens]RCX12346.1 HlyD family secretion protein [Anaerobacterium chartisolvens]